MADTTTKTVKYNQGDRVYFSMGEGLPTGWGKVCGFVNPVVIVELEKPIANYAYTHIYILDKQIVDAPKETPA